MIKLVADTEEIGTLECHPSSLQCGCTLNNPLMVGIVCASSNLLVSGREEAGFHAIPQMHGYALVGNRECTLC